MTTTPAPSCKDLLNAVMDDIMLCRLANPGRRIVTRCTARMYDTVAAGLRAINPAAVWPGTAPIPFLESVVMIGLCGDEMRAITRARDPDKP